MQGTHYPLVTLRRSQLVGPCASMFAERAEQDPAFRERWIDPIPEQGPFPFPIDKASLPAPSPPADRG